jgi:hypothetical protein
MRKGFVIVLLVAFAVGCALRSHEAPPEDIDKAGALFFQRLNAAEYETIYKDTAKKFKENKTKETIIESLKELTAKGRLQDYRRGKMTFEGEGKTHMASPVFLVTFEQARGELTLNFVDESGEWKLIGFAYKQHA